MMGDEVFNLGIENEALRDKIGEVDEKWLNDSKNRIKLDYNDKKNKSNINVTNPYIVYCLFLITFFTFI